MEDSCFFHFMILRFKFTSISDFFVRDNPYHDAFMYSIVFKTSSNKTSAFHFDNMCCGDRRDDVD